MGNSIGPRNFWAGRRQELCMFDSDLDGAKGKFGRRAFLLTSASAVAGTVLWSLRKPGVLAAAAPAAQGVPGEVTIVEFSDNGKKLKKERVPKVLKTEAEWQQQLSPGAFTITRHAGTELAFSGNIGTCTTRDCIAASVATTRCSSPIRSSSRERDGRASGRRSRRRMFGKTVI